MSLIDSGASSAPISLSFPGLLLARTSFTLSRRVFAQRRLDLGDRLLDVLVGHAQEIEVGRGEVLHVGRGFALRDGLRDGLRGGGGDLVLVPGQRHDGEIVALVSGPHFGERQDRKSTRLNSSHLVISYAVFCLKKNNTIR